MSEEAAEKAAEEWATLSVGEVPADRIMAPFSYLTLWKRDKKMLKEGFLAGAAWGAPKWISVREGLPEECALVLGYREIIGTLSVVFLSSQGKWMFAYEPEFASDITHWMPLPAAPKEEK